MSGDTHLLITDEEVIHEDFVTENTQTIQQLNDVNVSNTTSEEYVSCPTCQGSGKITRGAHNEQVALIPLSDSRLKPRRTWLYILITASVCFVLAGLLGFFLIPRGVVLKSLSPDLNVTNCTIIKSNSTGNQIKLLFKNTYIVENNNYYSITMKHLQMVTEFVDEAPEKLVQQSQNNTHISIGAKSQASVDVHTLMTFSGQDETVIEYSCTNEYIQAWAHYVILYFRASVDATITGHNYEDSLNSRQALICYFPQKAKTDQCDIVHTE